MVGIGWILFCASRRLLSSSMAAASAIITLAEDVIETDLLMTEGILVILVWRTGVICGSNACLSVCVQGGLKGGS